MLAIKAISKSLGSSIYITPLSRVTSSQSQAGTTTKVLASAFFRASSNSSCNCQKNQTPSESLEFFAKNKSTLGTGIFGVPNPEKGPLELKKILVKNLTYEEAIKRGANCESLKWIANDHVGYEAIAKKAVDCSIYTCNGDGECSYGCLCDRATWTCY